MFDKFEREIVEFLDILPVSFLCSLCGVLVKGTRSMGQVVASVFCGIVAGYLAYKISHAMGLNEDVSVVLNGVTSIIGHQLVSGWQKIGDRFSDDPLKTVSDIKRAKEGDYNEKDHNS